MPKIKVLRVIARMNVGGPAFLVRDLIEKLDASKFEQILVYGVCEGEENEIPNLNRLGNAHRLQKFGRRINLFRDFISMWQLIRVICSEKPNIIDTHTFKAGFLIRFYYLFLPLSRVKLVHHYHGHLLNGYFSRQAKVIYRLLEIVLSRHTDILVTDGDLVKEELINERIAPREKFVTIRPGINIKYSAIPTIIPEDAVGIGLRSPIVAYIGRLAPVKRPDRYLQVVKELETRGSDCIFKMYGEGELLAETESKILQLNLNMEVQPFQSDIFEILKDVDILVMTSDNEGTPLTVMQASCAGVPCIGTNVGSMRDIVADGVNGFLVDTDYVSIANEIEKLVSNLNELSSLQNSSSLHAKRHFDIKNFVEAHENIYLTLVNRGKSLSR